MTRVLYIAYWGAAEPLGQSLVLPAIERLSRAGVTLALVTYDKKTDRRDHQRMSAVGRRLETAGVDWIALGYHKSPRIPATAFDIVWGWFRSVLHAYRAGRPHVVHARTFIGGVVGLLVAETLGSKLIYHNEGFYPDEQVDGGFWAAGSPMHRATSWIERRLYARADGLIALSQRAADVLCQLPETIAAKKPVTVVPSCTNLEHFRLAETTPPIGGPVRFVYTGAVGGRYQLDRVARFVACSEAQMGPVQLTVITRTDPATVSSLLESGGLSRGAWRLRSLRHEEMPAELVRHQVGLFFLARGISEYGCSPTKIGEYWACGLPVVTTPNVSDTDAIIERLGVGVIVREDTDEAYALAARELQHLLADPQLPARCRRAAEEHYALEPAVTRQLEMYRRLAGETA